MKIKSNTTNNDLPCRFGVYQRPSSERNKETIHKKSAPTQFVRTTQVGFDWPCQSGQSLD